MLMKRIAILTLIISSVTTILLSQQPAEKPTTQSDPTVFDVKVNFAAINAQGIIVESLSKEEVKLFEDGVEQTITSVSKNASPLSLALVVDNTGSMRSHISVIPRIG